VQALGPEGATSSVEMEPLALIARLAAFVPPPKRHTVRYFGVLSSHAAARSQVVPHTPAPADVESDPEKPKRNSRYIRWSELLRRVYGIEVICTKCDGRARSAREVAGRAVRPGVPWDNSPLRLISLIKSGPIAKKILEAMHLPSEAPGSKPQLGI
jgi:hypothetical protein